MEPVRAILASVDVSRVRQVYLASYAPADLCEIPDPFGYVIRAINKDFPDLKPEYRGPFKTGAEAFYEALNDMTAGGTTDRGDVLVLGSEKMAHLEPAVAAGLLSARGESA